mgnify:CR=1 FL=1
MRFLRRSLVGLFLFSVTLGLFAYAGQSVYSALKESWAEEPQSRPSRERVFAVNVLKFQPGTVTPVMTSFGELRSRRTLEVRATSAGTIVDLADSFEEGGQVKAGDLLLQVDPSDAQSALDVAKTDLSEAEAELREAVAALSLSREDVGSALKQAGLRQQALSRQQQLQTRGLGTEDAVESAALAEASAQQSVLSRRQALAQAEARVEQAENGVSRRSIALAEAERRLKETSLYAEFSGTLSGVSVVQGGLVQNNERIAQLVDADALEVAFRVSTTEYARLLDENGALIRADVDVTLDVLGVDLTSKGVISREGASVGEGQTGRQIFARLQDAKGFRPGDFVTVQISEPELRFVAALPSTAVDSNSSVLIVGEDERLEVAQVSILRRQGDSVLVRARDLSGRMIVAERSPLLGAGIKVRAIQPGVAAVPEAPAMVALTQERRAKLVAFVEANNRMPEDAKKRVLAQLAEPEVSEQVVQRIEARMGG